MAPRECFGVVVRAFGLVALAASVLYLYSGIIVLFSTDAAASNLGTYFVATILSLLVGRYLLKGAPHVMTFAYGESAVAHPNQKAHCNFCGKSHADVKKLIQGPGVYICDACVGVCKYTLEKEFSKEKSQTEQPGGSPQAMP